MSHHHHHRRLEGEGSHYSHDNNQQQQQQQPEEEEDEQEEYCYPRDTNNLDDLLKQFHRGTEFQQVLKKWQVNNVTDLVIILDEVLTNPSIRQDIQQHIGQTDLQHFLSLRHTSRRLSPYYYQQENAFERRVILRHLTTSLRDNQIACLHQPPLTIDLAFLVEGTSRMKRTLEKLSSGFLSILSSILHGKDHPPLLFRFALVVYRDEEEGCPREQHPVYPFTTSLFHFRDSLMKVDCVGGQRYESQDVLGGLRAAAKEIEWKSQLRLLYHIAAVPCHGAQYHDHLSDAYPQGDPSGEDPIQWLSSLRQQAVDFTFLKFGKKTARMVGVLNQQLGEEYIKEQLVGKNGIIKVLLFRLKESIQTAAISLNTAKQLNI